MFNMQSRKLAPFYVKSICPNYWYATNQKRQLSNEQPIITRMQLKRYCDVLGVPVTASEPKIKQAFYQRSLLVHPDKNKSSHSQRDFTEICDAYQALISFKRSSSNESAGKSTWRTGSDNNIRPWFKKNNQAKVDPIPPMNFSNYDANFHQHFADVISSNTETTAGEWCDDYYQKQLQQDAALHIKSRRKVQKKQPNEDICTIM